MGEGDEASRRAPFPVIDGYDIVELIGVGGFSRVYRAIQDRLQREVAVKVLNGTFDDERQRRVFERECRAMGRLSTHPHIVTVHDSAVTRDGHPYLVMELYDRSLRDHGALPVAELITIGAKLADALQALHDEGVVHRDIKPNNIFMSSRGEPAIGDFGISSLQTELTITGGAGFTIDYAAPELLQDARVTPAADIYALGACLYHLASGQVPYPVTTDGANKLTVTMAKILTDPPPTLSGDDVPTELAGLLSRCMAKSPTDRPATAAAVAAELRAIANTTPTTTQPRPGGPHPQPHEPTQPTPHAPPRSNRSAAIQDQPETATFHVHPGSAGTPDSIEGLEPGDGVEPGSRRSRTRSPRNSTDDPTLSRHEPRRWQDEKDPAAEPGPTLSRLKSDALLALMLIATILIFAAAVVDSCGVDEGDVAASGVADPDGTVAVKAGDPPISDSDGARQLPSTRSGHRQAVRAPQLRPGVPGVPVGAVDRISGQRSTVKLTR